MKVKLSMPRKTEADITPEDRSDIELFPKFYRRTGWSTLLYLVVTDPKKDKEDVYVLVINAQSKLLKLERLVEVIPVTEETKIEDADISRQLDDEIV